MNMVGLYTEGLNSGGEVNGMKLQCLLTDI